MANFVLGNNQSMPVSVQPVVEVGGVPQNSPISSAQKYVRAYGILGVIQIVLGVLCILFTVINLSIVSESFDPSLGLTYASPGIWAGAFFLATGILGIVSYKNPEYCQINAAMALAIFAAITAMLMFAIETPAAVYSRRRPGAVYAFHVLMSIMSMCEFIISITHSTLCCAVTCCGAHMSPPVLTTTVTTTAVPIVPGQNASYNAYVPQTIFQTQQQQSHLGYNPAMNVVGQTYVMSQAQPFPQPTSPVYDPPPQYTMQPTEYKDGKFSESIQKST
ncbi:unnamed protein product [Clavelina lepadiformis]|uniref:Uncharacterized protein n=1 Tax=Clavelina lepadiformis TaxID=159417 RepID=A0ABP0GPI6_CLALP